MENVLLFLVLAVNSNRFGVTRSYSSRPFLCALDSFCLLVSYPDPLQPSGGSLGTRLSDFNCLWLLLLGRGSSLLLSRPLFYVSPHNLPGPQVVWIGSHCPHLWPLSLLRRGTALGRAGEEKEGSREKEREGEGHNSHHIYANHHIWMREGYN